MEKEKKKVRYATITQYVSLPRNKNGETFNFDYHYLINDNARNIVCLVPIEKFRNCRSSLIRSFVDSLSIPYIYRNTVV